ncbi:MAG: heat-inducible transcription repressor HrcA [Deltaproteobacteria bacterium]|nr:heat-inducible transcription repressor HrcA [Deltaproteobacteria bacterium]
MREDLSERQTDILRAIVFDYIAQVEPVSSKTVATKYTPSLSSATVRNIMADLEARGYLFQPHKSAGRIPTASAFQFYVDSLAEIEEPSRAVKELITSGYNDTFQFDEIMRETSRLLSLISHCAGVVLAPRMGSIRLKRVKFVKIGGGDIMVVLVSMVGTVQSCVIHMDEDLNQRELDKMSGHLSGIADGLNLTQLRMRLIGEMREERSLYDTLLSKAMKIGMEVVTEPGRDDIYVDGAVNVLEQPEFSEDIKKLKELFRAFEEKSLLVRLLDKSVKSKGVHVKIGFEGGLDGMEGCSMVTASYGSSEHRLGTIGVIGPMRMNYPLVIPLVRYTSDLLGEIFEKRGSSGIDSNMFT